MGWCATHPMEPTYTWVMPMTPPSAASAIVAVALSWVVWQVIKTATAKHPLSTVPGPKSNSFLTGSILKIFNTDGWEYHSYLAKTFPGIARIPGPLGSSMLYIHDPKALHQIVVKDQDIFAQADDLVRVANLVFGPGLLSVHGQRHRKQRKALSPAFSVKNLREMAPIFYGIVHKLRKSIQTISAEGETEIDMLSWMSRTALELIGQSGFGTSFDTLDPEERPHPFAISLKNGMQAIGDLALWRFAVLPWAVHIGTAKFRRWVVDHLPWKKLQETVDFVDIIHNTSVEYLKPRRNRLREDKEDGWPGMGKISSVSL